MSDIAHKYSALIRARAPQELRDAVERAANRELTTASAYARKALINQLRADGSPLEAHVSSDARA